jgi:hypothetical protein
VNLPINHIYDKMSERPQDINQQEIDLEALNKLIDKALAE